MKRILRVINTKRGYVKSHSYSQGYSSFSTTDNVLKALDLNQNKETKEFTEPFFIGPDADHTEDEPTIEEYEISITRVI